VVSFPRERDPSPLPQRCSPTRLSPGPWAGLERLSQVGGGPWIYPCIQLSPHPYLSLSSSFPPSLPGAAGRALWARRDGKQRPVRWRATARPLSSPATDGPGPARRARGAVCVCVCVCVCARARGVGLQVPRSPTHPAAASRAEARPVPQRCAPGLMCSHRAHEALRRGPGFAYRFGPSGGPSRRPPDG
jgi:hypothetical protein